MVAHHIHTGTRRADNEFRIFKYFDKMLGGNPGLSAITGIKCWLSTAGLIGRTCKRNSQPLENPHHRFRHFRINGVNETLDKQCNLFLTAHNDRSGDLKKWENFLPSGLEWIFKTRNKPLFIISLDSYNERPKKSSVKSYRNAIGRRP